MVFNCKENTTKYVSSMSTSNTNNSINHPPHYEDRNTVKAQVKKSKKNKINLKKKDKFKVMTWNCNKISNKVSGFILLLLKETPDIIILTETKCNLAEENELMLKLEEDSRMRKKNLLYEIESQRRDENGGGVAILINKSIEYEKIDIDQFSEEATSITTKINGQPLAILAWYNAPNKNNINTEIIKWYDEKYKNYLIVGDLNAHCSPWATKQNRAGTQLNDALDSMRSIILNEEGYPTSYWGNGQVHAKNVLDLFIGSEICMENLREYKVMPISPVDIYQNKIPCPRNLCIRSKEKH